MPRFILNTCIACGTCADSCPMECISEGAIYEVDPDVCIDCGTCQAVCPTESIEER